MAKCLENLQPLLGKVPKEKLANLLSPTGILSAGLACAIAYRRSAVVKKCNEVLMALANQYETELAGVVRAVIKVLLAHCSRAKESSVWIPCMESAPFVAVKAPSPELLDTVIDVIVNRGSKLNKHAGCREAAGLTLSALLLSATRGEAAKDIVFPKVNAIIDAVVALLIDATKPMQGALTSNPDIREAGASCYVGLRMLDTSAATAVYSAIQQMHPIVLHRLLTP